MTLSAAFARVDGAYFAFRRAEADGDERAARRLFAEFVREVEGLDADLRLATGRGLAQDAAPTTGGDKP